MENINEEDEKSEYSDEQFEEEDVEEAQTVARVTKDKVGNALKQVRY